MMRVLFVMWSVFGTGVAAKGTEVPVGEWRFTSPPTPTPPPTPGPSKGGEGTEVIRDLSGNGHDLRVEGCQWVESKLGKALRVPADSGRIWCEKPGEALRPTTALGVIAWVRLLGSNPYCAVLNHGTGWGDAGTEGYRLLAYLDGVRLMLKAGRIINISGGTLIRGQWNQIAAMYNGLEAVVFINGQAVARELVQGPISYQGVEGTFEVGCADGGNLDGDIAS